MIPVGRIKKHQDVSLEVRINLVSEQDKERPGDQYIRQIVGGEGNRTNEYRSCLGVLVGCYDSTYSLLIAPIFLIY